MLQNQITFLLVVQNLRYNYIFIKFKKYSYVKFSLHWSTTNFLCKQQRFETAKKMFSNSKHQRKASKENKEKLQHLL